MNQPLTPAGAVAARPRNRYDRMEWAGAFGDLGTLIPFVAASIGVVGMDPTGVLLAFGIAMVASGLWYRTPVPVQPRRRPTLPTSIPSNRQPSRPWTGRCWSSPVRAPARRAC